MKDKEKQIEEMANCDKCVHKKICKNEFKGAPIIEFQGCEHYQPKLPEDSVVLSREEKQEYENLVKLLTYNKPVKSRVYDVVKGIKNRASKETAEKIFAKIDEELAECTIVNEGGYGWNYQGYEATDLRKRLTKLAKQFDVEIKE